MVAPASWTDPKTDIIGQVEDLAKRVDVLGKGRPKALLLSEMAWKYLGENETFNKRLDQRRRTEGSVVMPKFNDRGAAYVGTFTFGPYELEMWVYPEVFDAPYDLPGEGIPAGRTAPWVPINKVAVVNPHARRDKLFGGVPIHLKLNPEDASDLDIPSVPVPAAYDFRPYTRLEGWAVHAGVMSRPLLAPIEIDSWGTLEVFPVTEDSSPEVTTSATKEKATKKAA
jgi:PHD/YefM family antitoxin component YafN of YafNO toxin-antitoxin module